MTPKVNGKREIIKVRLGKDELENRKKQSNLYCLFEKMNNLLTRLIKKKRPILPISRMTGDIITYPMTFKRYCYY